jgi:uncharacterized protein (DUF697 family)
MAILGGATSFWKILGEIRPGAIKGEAERSFCILICGETGAGKRALRGALAASRWPTEGTTPYVRIVEGAPTDLFGAELALYVVDATRGIYHSHWDGVARLSAAGIPVIRVYNKLDLVADPKEFERQARRSFGGVEDPLVFVEAVDATSVKRGLAPQMLRAAPDLKLPLGRRLPLLRDEAAAQVIDETSRVNAEFAILSSLPANIPLVSLATVGADLIVMTKNQAMMLVKIAAIYGWPLDRPFRLIAELAPVVGAAFMWRTIARSLVGLLPGLVSAVPKTLIAYVGTSAVGRAAQVYYRSGDRPSRASVDSYTRDALAAARRALPAIRIPGRGDEETAPVALPPAEQP